MSFPRQEYWGRLPFPSPGNLSDPEIEPMSPALAGRSLPATWKAHSYNYFILYTKVVKRVIPKNSHLEENVCFLFILY